MDLVHTAGNPAAAVTAAGIFAAVVVVVRLGLEFGSVISMLKSAVVVVVESTGQTAVRWRMARVAGRRWKRSWTR